MTLLKRVATRRIPWLAVLAIVIGVAATSYLQPLESRVLAPVRVWIKLLYASDTDASILTRNMDELFHPVALINSVLPDARDILHHRGSVDDEAETRVLHLADTLLARSQPRVHGGTAFVVWEYGFDWPTYNLEAPWRSGMAQGLAIIPLLAAHLLTGDTSYLATARLAANALAIPINSGGVAVQVHDGIWFEEYAGTFDPPAMSPLVLNGHMFAIEGLRELVKVDRTYGWMLDAGLAALKSQLPHYDIKVWSMYDRVGIPANPKYHDIHIRQLTELYAVTGEEGFRQYARRFRRQKLLPFHAFVRLWMHPGEVIVALSVLNSVLAGVALFWIAGLRNRMGATSRNS
jgi:hypothetical protein